MSPRICRFPGSHTPSASSGGVQVLPEQVVYLDDRLMFVEVGRSLGVAGIYHTGCQSTRAALAQLGLSLEG
jgi:hypothetical protein